MITSTLVRPMGNIPPSRLSCVFDDDSVLDPQTHIKLIQACCEDVGSSLSYRVMWCLWYKDTDALLNLECSPNSYDDAMSYLKDAQIIALIKKYPGWQTTTDPKHAAKKTFISCEAQCRDTNQRFWSQEPSSWSVHSVLAIAQRKISNILRSVPHVSELPFRFGPGASYSVKYNTSALDKLASLADVTPACYGLATEMLRHCPGWRPNKDVDIVGPVQPLQFTVVKGDRLSFVPKTAKTDRPIGINPLLNGVIQKGIGAVIRKRLRPFLDLDNLQPIHRSLAREASLNDGLSTIDLKSASDTLAFALVQSLLPDDWFELLYTCRSSQYNIEGNWYPYQKFSAMGNGYTFELETLIFFALSSACAEFLCEDEKSVSVYGDDIIIPQRCASLLKDVLAYCGFQLNDEKSFICGPFRESCGGDYFRGTDVRPFFLKDKVTYRTLFLLHNQLAVSGNCFLFKKLYRLVRRIIGKEYLSFFRCPLVDDDFALFDRAMPLGSYNRLVPFEEGKKKSQKVKAYGHAYGLYRLMVRYEPDADQHVAWYKMRNYRIKYRLYRYVHL